MRLLAQVLLAITAIAHLLTMAFSFKCYVCPLDEERCDNPKLSQCSPIYVLPALLRVHDLDYIETNVTSYVENSDEYMCLSFDGHQSNYKYCMFREVDFCNLYQLSCSLCYKEGCNNAKRTHILKPLLACSLLVLHLFNQLKCFV